MQVINAYEIRLRLAVVYAPKSNDISVRTKLASAVLISIQIKQHHRRKAKTKSNDKLTSKLANNASPG